MSRLAHLSDLHFGHDVQRQVAIYDGLVGTLAELARAGRVDLLVLTGDVFDSSSADSVMIDRFLALYDRLDAALGGQVPALIIPGNHDRREAGVFAPWSGRLFEELQARLHDRPWVRVQGNTTPFLAQRVSYPFLPADLVAYDSTYLPEGRVSAGGLVRREDLIQLADQLMETPADRPLLFLLHHHLVPTPVTDTTRIDTRGRPPWERLVVNRVLPALVGSGDREELTMTALGAGTALSALHLLGRAVVVLHGHKHYPTARLLKAIERDEGDLLLASAGSCGTATSWSSGEFDEAPRLWPSFNVVDVTERAVTVSAVAWSPWEKRRNPPKEILHAERAGLRWTLQHDHAAPPPFDPVLSLNETVCALSPSQKFFDRYDLEVRREVRALPVAVQQHYWEVVEGPKGAHIVDLRTSGLPGDEKECPARLRISADGKASYRVIGGAVASLAEAGKQYGLGSAFEWVGLLNRTRAVKARLIADLGDVRTAPFASATDLTTGKERPLALRREGARVQVEMDDCPARTLLRVYWPLRA